MVEAGHYNTRIANVCLAPRYQIARFNCQQGGSSPTSYSYVTSIECTATCRATTGPVVVSWTSSLSLQPTVTTDVWENGCSSTRVSNCPPPSGVVPGTLTRFQFPPVEITVTITDSSGHSSTDRARVQCTDPNYW